MTTPPWHRHDPLFFVLRGKEAIPEDDTLRAAQWWESAERRVALSWYEGVVRVSSVFLGVNHQYGDGPPLVFETMAFFGRDNFMFGRYTTWQEAERGHRACVTDLRARKLAPCLRAQWHDAWGDGRLGLVLGTPGAWHDRYGRVEGVLLRLPYTALRAWRWLTKRTLH